MFCSGIKKYINYLMLICLLFINTGCAGVVVAAAAASAAGVAVIGGTVAEVDKTERALAVEKCIYAIEKEKGEITELSFADGYVKGVIDGYDVYMGVYEEDNKELNVSVRVSKYLMPNVELAEKLLKNYRNFKK